MTQLREVYYCELCGNVVEVLNNSDPVPACCGQTMTKLDEKTTDEGKEKHVPVVEENGSGVKVTVGSVEHPMEEDHYIKFIEVLTTSGVCRAELSPGQSPSAEICVPKSEIVEVREWCTKHGLWRA